MTTSSSVPSTVAPATDNGNANVLRAAGAGMKVVVLDTCSRCRGPLNADQRCEWCKPIPAGLQPGRAKTLHVKVKR